MSSWADVSSAVAGALVFIVGAAVPKAAAVLERILDRAEEPSVPQPSKEKDP